MELITTHIGADFDALASVVAARKLYPQAKAVLPGSPEKSVRDFLSIWKDELKLSIEKDIDYAAVDKLILVETRVASRIGLAEKLLAKPGLKIEIYDHHPRTKRDIKGEKDVYKPTGATVTMLLDIIKNRKIAITPLEATVMALGIYEDTGSLTFQTTTRRDIDMVGYLFSQGASLNTVSTYLKRELTPKQLAFLSLLINSTHDYLINGVHVGVASAESDGYIEDAALLVHKLLDVENFNVIFAFIKEGPRIHLVCRSNIPYVKVDKIAESFGGGGHPYAASAKISGVNQDDAVEKLLSQLKANIKPEIFAEDILSGEPARAFVSNTVSDCRKVMKASGLDGLAVFEKNKLAGLITSAAAESACRKGFGHSRVKGYLKTKFSKAAPRTPLFMIEDIIAKEKTGLVPVFRKNRFAGLISRSDIARAMHKDLVAGKRSVVRARKKITLPEKIMTIKIKKHLSPRIYKILKLIGTKADRMGIGAFCVGGFVRDMLLDVKNFDVDIVLEGKGLQFAKALADMLKGALVVHKRFGTATVVTDIAVSERRGPQTRKEKFKIDIATARTEYYEYPAALPQVKFSSIKQDLYRRDFTINAMAVSLNKKTFGRLVDFFHGQRDLKRKQVRVLHDLSFVEDPTRIFRAVRFEQRYNFSMSPHTEELIKTAVSLDMFGRTQKQRLRDEIILILSEERPVKALKRMHKLHELRFIHPKIRFTEKMAGLFEKIDEVCGWYRMAFQDKRPIDSWIIYFMAMCEELSLGQLYEICQKFVFTKGDEKRLLSANLSVKKAAAFLDQKKSIPPSRIYNVLEPLAYEVILYIMAKSRTQAARERILMFFKRYNNVRLSIGGKDLKSLGMKPGPRYKNVLDKILYEKLDGKIVSHADELARAKELAQRS